MINTSSIKDLKSIKQLLKQNNLPFEDVGVSEIRFLTIKRDQEIIACGGLEFFEEIALLRSVSVREGYKNEGLGSKLTQMLMDEAERMGAKTVYLLTTTALEYFKRKGFVVVTREEAPVEIQTSVEFSKLCPDSAALMRKKI
ncbi:MAG: GNAT family N-acetyltransferase [Balneola sp.]|nr:MAG: GNAT family N-acetyltransferase [Balneola sp.]